MVKSNNYLAWQTTSCRSTVTECQPSDRIPREGAESTYQRTCLWRYREDGGGWQWEISWSFRGATLLCPLPRALSIRLLFLLAYTRQQPRGLPPVFRFPANETSLQVYARFPHRISAARLRFSSSLQLLVADTSSFYPVSVRAIVREGSALRQMEQLPRHFSNS